MIILVKSSLIVSTLLLVSVTIPGSSNPSSPTMDTSNIEVIRVHNMRTLKHIEDEFTKIVINKTDRLP